MARMIPSTGNLVWQTTCPKTSDEPLQVRANSLANAFRAFKRAGVYPTKVVLLG